MSKASIFSFSALPHAPALPLLLLMVTIITVGGMLIVEGVPPKAAGSPEALRQEIAGAEPGTLEAILSSRLADYKANSERFEANLRLQALMVLITVLLIMRRSNSLKLFGNDVPLQWLHVFVPLLLGYLWLRFGFLLDELIENRIRGVDIAMGLHPPELAKSLFVDASFIDGWLSAFVDTDDFSYSGIPFTPGTAVFLVLVLGTLAAANHASMLALVAVATRRYLNTRSAAWYWVYYLLPLIPLAILLGSHLQFAYSGANRNWVQTYVGLAVFPFLTILLGLSLRVDRESFPESIECLRRRRSMSRDDPTALADFGAGHGPEYATRVALIGDSLSTAFHVGTVPGMIWRMWRCWRPSWFVNRRRPVVGLDSVDLRLARHTRIVAQQYAAPRATVHRTRRSFLDLVTSTRHMAGQVGEVLAGRFPHLLLLWIGHNNMNWREAVAASLDQQENHFAHAYEAQLWRLLHAAIAAEQRTVIIVFGMINFHSFFEARQDAEGSRKEDPSLYPFLEVDYRYFESMKPEHRAGMIEFAARCNARLEEMCARLSVEIDGTNTRLVYSDAMARADIGSAGYLNGADAWHPSLLGHGVLADAAHAAIAPHLAHITQEREPGPSAASNGSAIAANCTLWDSWTRAHRDSAFYDVPGFLAGRDPLNRIETDELGDVAGKRFLHLQCHFGIDTLGWARRGARVTGVDFSPEAIATARSLAEQAGLDATFVESDVYALRDRAIGEFDIVHTSYGVLSWLPDLDRWAEVIAAHLAPGGLFHLVENHPFTMMLDDDGVSIRWPYLTTGGPMRFESAASYAAPMTDHPLPEYNWPHGIGEVVTSLTRAGLRVAWLREYPRTPYPFPGFLERRPEGDYGWPGGREDIPLTFSIGAFDPRLSPKPPDDEPRR